MPGKDSWLPAPSALDLAAHEVHVWRLRLDLTHPGSDQIHRVLNSDEQERAARFHFEKDRRHYAAARAFLRILLGRYLHVDPAAVRFSYNSYGKPDLAENPSQPALCFNLAHSGGLALLAFTRGREIGIDLERIRPNFATQEIAERFFAPAEIAVLRSLSEEVRTRAFFDCWTRKEAFIKARGLGLSLSLRKFAVSLAPEEEPALLSVEEDPQAPTRWMLKNLEVAEGFAAALAVQGRDCQIRCYEGTMEE